MTEATLSRSAIFSARPTLRIAGQEDARLSTQLLALRMEENEGGLSHLELRLNNWVATDGSPELAFDAGSTLRLGAELAVYSGDAAAPTEIFQGRVSALEMVCDYGKPPELVVLAEDALGAARRLRPGAMKRAAWSASAIRSSCAFKTRTSALRCSRRR